MALKLTNIDKKAAEALQLLTDASNKQLQLIADAALNATKLLATQTAEATKVRNEKGADDHDKIIEVLVKMDELKTDIKELSDGTTTRITNLENGKLNTCDSYPVLYKVAVEKMFDDHENRIRINTIKITQIMTWGSAAIIAIGIAEFLLNLLIK